MIEPYYQSEKATLYCGDCLQILPQISGVDAVVTDPPYGIGGYVSTPSKWRRRAGHRPEAWDGHTADLSAILKAAPIVVIWGGNNYALTPSRGWLVWNKPDAPPSMGQSELAWTNLDQNTKQIKWSIGATNAERNGHPTQKPIAVMLWTISKIPATESILDPFMGSGTTGVAAVKLGRRFIGIEIEPKYCEIAKRRIIEAEESFALLEPPKRMETAELQFE